ncbi:hypothetical protein F2981_03210 [Sinorhizobium meliloti]|nr:hypothetical protein [Sinorhizobium meliloti]
MTARRPHSHRHLRSEAGAQRELQPRTAEETAARSESRSFMETGLTGFAHLGLVTAISSA